MSVLVIQNIFLDLSKILFQHFKNYLCMKPSCQRANRSQWSHTLFGFDSQPRT